MPIPLLLHGTHRHPGIAYQTLGPWIVPWQFESVEEEYRALRARAGLIDYSTQALIEVGGSDRSDFLHRLLTNDIKRIRPGGGCLAALLTPSAKLISEMLVLADADSVWLLCDLQAATLVAHTLDRYLFSEQVTLMNHERRDAVLALQGPESVELLGQLCGSAAALSHRGDHAATQLGDIPVRLVRHTLTGDAGALCLVGADDARAAWDWLAQRGARLGVKPVGWGALETARIEGGIPRFGFDMDETNLLPETGLDMVAANDSKGCYVGQEVVARLRTYGSVSKKLMGLLPQDDQLPEAGDGILLGDHTVGQVTSACRSLALRRPIAMGYVSRQAYLPDTLVEIAGRAGRSPALIGQRPFVPWRDVG